MARAVHISSKWAAVSTPLIQGRTRPNTWLCARSPSWLSPPTGHVPPPGAAGAAVAAALPQAVQLLHSSPAPLHWPEQLRLGQQATATSQVACRSPSIAPHRLVFFSSKKGRWSGSRCRAKRPDPLSPPWRRTCGSCRRPLARPGPSAAPPPACPPAAAGRPGWADAPIDRESVRECASTRSGGKQPPTPPARGQPHHAAKHQSGRSAAPQAAAERPPRTWRRRPRGVLDTCSRPSVCTCDARRPRPPLAARMPLDMPPPPLYGWLGRAPAPAAPTRRVRRPRLRAQPEGESGSGASLACASLGPEQRPRRDLVIGLVASPASTLSL